ncbi:MAG: hypothetical protein U5K74_09035 [Gemmatimonadaceae bacterium]|nr:hypothetical protein [Gemmatimonadaceae bacterium]
MPETPISSLATTDGDPRAQQRARRGTLITLGLLIALVALIVALTPIRDDASDTRLTTRKFGPGNARLASDLARRLGWTVRTTGVPLRGTADTNAIYAVFDGPTPMAPAERAWLLDAVTRGAGLLVAPSGAEPFRLLSTLGLHQGPPGLVTPTPLGDCPPETDAFSSLRVRTRMLTFDASPDTSRRAPPRVPYPASARTLLTERSDDRPRRRRLAPDRRLDVRCTAGEDTAQGAASDGGRLSAGARPRGRARGPGHPPHGSDAQLRDGIGADGGARPRVSVRRAQSHDRLRRVLPGRAQRRPRRGALGMVARHRPPDGWC